MESASDPQLSDTTRNILFVAAAAGSVLFALSTYAFFKVVSRILTYLPAKEKPSKPSKQAKEAAPARQQQQQQQARAEAADRGPDLKALIKESQKAAKQKGTNKDDQASHHPLFVNTLKGHGDTVHSVAWSPDGQVVVSSCEDMYIRVFEVGADPTMREPKMRRIKTPRIPVGAGFVDAKGSERVSAVMRGIPDTMAALFHPVKKSPTEAAAYEAAWEAKQVHARGETTLAARCVPATPGRGALIVSCSQKKDVRVLDATTGKELAMLEPNSMINHDLAVSDDGRFVAVASFLNEVKVWENKFARDSGAFSGSSKAMELKGHKGQVMSVAFNPNNTRAVTVSKDLTLRVWNIDVRYHLSEDPKTLVVASVPLAGGKWYQRLAYGPNGLVAGCHEGIVHILSDKSGELLDSIDAHEGAILSMAWCPVPLRIPGSSQPVPVLATCGRDKRVRLWRGPQ